MPQLWNLQSKQGLHTGPLHGFFQSLSSVVSRYKRRRGVIVAWDLGSSIQRLKVYSSYKEGRLNKEDPKLLERLADEDVEKKEKMKTYIWSRQFLHKILLPMTGCLTIQVRDLEADDIIAWVCRLFENTNQKITIISTDHDFYQLVSDTVEVWDPIRKVMIDKDTLIEKENLIPEKYYEHWMLIRSILGDTADKIPGVKGLGPKYAHEISRTVLLEGEDALDKSKVRVQKYLEGKDVIERNMDLMDLNHGKWPEIGEAIEQAVKMSCTLNLPLDSELALHAKLHQLDLTRAREVVPDLLQANITSDFKQILLDQIK